jgi:hypothetical protein
MWRPGARVIAVYAAAAVASTWPLAISLTSRLGALDGPGDPYLNLWILGWGLRAWTTDPASVLDGRVFDANIFHPAQGTLAYSDHFLLQALALSPVYAATGDAVLCYNLLLIGSIAASGLAMHGLARSVTGSAPGAYVAGLVWACWPYRTAHLLHIQLQALYFMPLALWALHRVVARGRWRDAVLLGALTALQSIASVYYGIMTAVTLAAAGIALAYLTGQIRSSRLWMRAAGAAALAILCSAPVVIPYIRSQQSEGFGRTLFEASNHSASWQSYTQVPPSNLLYGRTGLLAPRELAPSARDRRGVEHQMFPGVVVVALAMVGLARRWGSDARAVVRSAAVLVVVGTVLSFGPEGLRSLYAALHDNVFGFQAIRAPARFAVIAVLGLALLAAVGVGTLTSGAPAAEAAPRSGARQWTSLLAAAVFLEYLNVPLPLAAAPARHTDTGQWLAREAEPGPVLYLPLASDIANTVPMVHSLEHARPIVNGYSGQRPAFFSALVESLDGFPSPVALATLLEIDVRFIVSPIGLAGDGPASPLVERARFADGVIYELRWTPESLAAIDTVPSPPPPPPGPPPFVSGERTVFDVYWDGGPLNVPAGRAELTVTQGASAEQPWRFELTAETASWVSRFFQARDRFVTTADPVIRPLEHTREIREGRRQLDRTYIYDAAARRVRVGSTPANALDPGALTLPLVPEARDAVTALFYVRTLPFVTGARFSAPLNEAGQGLVLQVDVAGEEAVVANGKTTRAWRLEPRIMRRIERRRPVAVTLWMSADERRVPLRAIVDAGFGRIRLELADYVQG